MSVSSGAMELLSAEPKSMSGHPPNNLKILRIEDDGDLLGDEVSSCRLLPSSSPPCSPPLPPPSPALPSYFVKHFLPARFPIPSSLSCSVYHVRHPTQCSGSERRTSLTSRLLIGSTSSAYTKTGRVRLWGFAVNRKESCNTAIYASIVPRLAE